MYIYIYIIPIKSHIISTEIPWKSHRIAIFWGGSGEFPPPHSGLGQRCTPSLGGAAKETRVGAHWQDAAGAGSGDVDDDDDDDDYLCFFTIVCINDCIVIYY